MANVLGGVCIGRGSTEFYAAHRFVLGSPALGGVRIYLVRYRGRTRGGEGLSKIKCGVEIYGIKIFRIVCGKFRPYRV